MGILNSDKDLWWINKCFFFCNIENINHILWVFSQYFQLENHFYTSHVFNNYSCIIVKLENMRILLFQGPVQK